MEKELEEQKEENERLGEELEREKRQNRQKPSSGKMVGR